MTRIISFQDRLCQICMTPHNPAALFHVDEQYRDVCSSCLRDLLREPERPETAPAAGAGEDAPPLDAKRAATAGIFRRFSIAVNVRETLRTAARVGSYGVIFLSVTPGHETYPIVQGAIAADLVTWVIISHYSLALFGLTVAVELTVYFAAIGLYWMNYESAFQFPGGGEPLALAMLSFLTVGMLKIGWWMIKVFLVDEE